MQKMFCFQTTKSYNRVGKISTYRNLQFLLNSFILKSMITKKNVFLSSTKQKLITKSSTKTEIIGMSKYIPFKLWLNMSLKEQKYNLMDIVIRQSNCN